MEIIDLSISGMECDACARHVASALVALPGVESADVLLDEAVAHVSFDPLLVRPADMRRAVEEEGYGLRNQT